MESPIGVIDSGLGGVTVLKELVKLLPNENYIYIGDTLNVPYGDKNIEQIRVITYSLIDYLLSKNIKLLVIACNTITALLIDELKLKYNIPIIGVIEPTAKQANEIANGNIGVIATVRAIESNAYQKILKGNVYAYATPTLVPIIENNTVNTPEGMEVIKTALNPLQDKEIDTLILGCTHYPIIKNEIQSILKVNNIVSSGQVVAPIVKDKLKELNLLNDKNGSILIYVTKGKDLFNNIIKEWFDYPYDIENLTL